MPLQQVFASSWTLQEKHTNTQAKQTSCLSKSTCVLWMCKELYVCCRLSVKKRRRGKYCLALWLEPFLEAKARCLEISLSKLVYEYIYICIHTHIVYSIHAYTILILLCLTCLAYYRVFLHVPSTCYLIPKCNVDVTACTAHRTQDGFYPIVGY